MLTKTACRLLTALTFGAFLVAGGSIGSATAATGSLVLDQQQTIIDGNVGGLVIGGQSGQVIAQTVTAGLTGSLEVVSLSLGCDADATLTLQIEGVTASGAPDDNVVSSTTFSNLANNGSAFRDLALATPVTMTAGQKFAFVLSATAIGQFDGCGVFQGPLGDSYPGGDIYFHGSADPVGSWFCQCIFSPAHLDLPFETWVLPAVTYDGLIALTNSFVSNPGLAASMTTKLRAAQSAAARGDAAAKAGAIGAYVNEVDAQSGNALTAAQASQLVHLAQML